MEARDTPWRRDAVDTVLQLARESDSTELLLRALLEDLDDPALTLTLLAARARQRSHWEAAYTRATALLDDELGPPPA
jgi:hypothetical protein